QRSDIGGLNWRPSSIRALYLAGTTMTVIRRKEDKGVHSMNIQKIFARTLGALMIAGLTGCATIESFLEVAAPIAEGISQGMAGSTAATYQAAARSNTCGG